MGKEFERLRENIAVEVEIEEESELIRELRDKTIAYLEKWDELLDELTKHKVDKVLGHL